MDYHRYDVCITRALPGEHWRSGHISDDEWRKIVATDPELKFSIDDWLNCDDLGYTNGRIHWVDWLGHRSAFVWCGSTIEAQDPDQATIQKMAQIANRLNARVVGENGEEYGPNGEAKPIPAIRRLPWWQKLLTVLKRRATP